MKTDRRSIAERFWPKVRKGPDCWLWAACTANGYGTIGSGGKHGHQLLAHRVAWEMAYGPIPPGLCVLHHCDNRLCVRHGHLFLGTHKDNTQDMMAKGRHRGNQNTNRVRCVHDHPLSGGNLRVESDGRRRCRACCARRSRDYQARVRSKAVADQIVAAGGSRDLAAPRPRS
jgi:hypothetical protein